MNFSSINEFRSKATPDDMHELESFINSQTNKAKAFPNEKYNFSYSSAAKELHNKGLLGGPTKKANKTPDTDFIIHSGEKKECTSRCFCVQTDILKRIDRLASENCQYSKKAIINQLLDDALRKYNY